MLADDGTTHSSMQLKREETVAISRGANRLIELATPSRQMPRVRQTVFHELKVSPEYVEVVLQDDPVVYWRFESEVELEDGSTGVRNSAGRDIHAQIVRQEIEPDAIQLVNGAVQFTASRSPRYLLSTQPIGDSNWKEYTIEFWIKSKTLEWGAIVGVFSGDQDRKHAALIEIANQSYYVHQAGAIRFLHRQPAGETGGLNLFSQTFCASNQWYHVVAVKTRSGLRIHINGERGRWVSGDRTTSDVARSSEPNSVDLLLGTLDKQRTHRQFVGSLDELAVYDRALSESEINQHFDASRLARHQRSE